MSFSIEYVFKKVTSVCEDMSPVNESTRGGEFPGMICPGSVPEFEEPNNILVYKKRKFKIIKTVSKIDLDNRKIIKFVYLYEINEN